MRGRHPELELARVRQRRVLVLQVLEQFVQRHHARRVGQDDADGLPVHVLAQRLRVNLGNYPAQRDVPDDIPIVPDQVGP